MVNGREYVIETEGLVKMYGSDIKALDGVSIKIPRGKIVGYVGPNGSGKTTTIKILTNLIKPTAGKAYINGIDANKYPKEALCSVGALIEVPGIYDYLTPHEILVYFGKIYGMKKSDIDNRIVEVLKMVKLSSWENKKVGAFSTGMQRRFAIAKSFFHDPEILIMDEPVIGLDPKGIKEVRELIKSFQRENKTIFLSSHLLNEVADTCDSVIFINDGKILTHDTVDNITGSMHKNIIDVKFLKQPNYEELNRIKSFELITGLKIVNGIVHLDYDGTTVSSSKILSQLVSSGFEIISFTPEIVSLEDVYVSTMGDERGVK
jgi:ABC-2 type transport system ATP-binding protein